jgi:hypothetical protein
VAWRRAGYERDTQGNTVRLGLVRVRVNGAVTRKLGRQPLEIPWTLTLQGSPNPGRGVIAVHIAPGSGDQQCLGADVADCVFEADDVFRATTLQHRRVCVARGADQSVYALTAPGRRTGFAVFARSWGPDGEIASVDVYWSGTPPDCKDPIG